MLTSISDLIVANVSKHISARMVVEAHEADSWCPFSVCPSLFSVASFRAPGLSSCWDLPGLPPLPSPSFSRSFDGERLRSRLRERLFLSLLLDRERLLFSWAGDLLLWSKEISHFSTILLPWIKLPGLNNSPQRIYMMSTKLINELTFAPLHQYR